MKKLNPKGFAAIEAALMVVILAIIGGTGFYVYTANQKTGDTLDSASKAAQNEPEKATKKQSPAADYLSIKEWNVKIKLSNKSKGVFYQVKRDTQTGDITNLEVFSPAASSIKGKNGVSCAGEYIAYLVRYDNNDPALDDPLTEGYFVDKKIIGNFTYAVETKKQYGPECMSQNSDGDYVADQEASDQFNALVEAFVSDFKTIQAQ